MFFNINSDNHNPQAGQTQNGLLTVPYEVHFPYHLKTAGGVKYKSADGIERVADGMGGMYKTVGPMSDKVVEYFKNADPVVCEETKTVWVKVPAKGPSKIVTFVAPLLQQAPQHAPLLNGRGSVIYPKVPVQTK